jgi:hypothetical protein
MRIGLDARGVTNRQIFEEIKNQKDLAAQQEKHDRAVLQAEAEKQAAIARTSEVSRGGGIGSAAAAGAAAAAKAEEAAAAVARAEQKVTEARNAQQGITDAVRVSEANLGRLRSQLVEDEKNFGKQSAAEYETQINKRSAALQKLMALEAARREMVLDAANAATKGARDGAASEQTLLDQNNARFIASLLQRLGLLKAEREQEHALAIEDGSFNAEIAQIQMDRARQNHALSLAEEKSYLARLFEAKRAAIQREIEYLQLNDPNNVLKKRQLHNQLILEERRYQQQSEALERGHVGRMRQLVDGLNGAMASGFQSAIDGMIRGTQTLAQAFSEIALQMLNVLIGSLAQMLAQWITTHIIMKIFGQQTAVANATTQISAAASIAGANGVASWALAPWPIDAGAPAFGAAMAASARMFGALKFAKGGFVPGSGFGDTVPALLTPGEYVVPRQLAGFAAEVVSGATTRGPVGRAAAVGGTVNVHNHVNAVDRNSFSKMLRANRRNMGREFRRLARNGAFRFAH